jgi:tetratricopeptide (TPR) repeat protein
MRIDRMLPFCLVLCIALAVPAQQPSTFAADYAEAQKLVQRGAWAKAKTALDQLLVRHEGSLDAIACREALVEDMSRCVFGIGAVPPKPESLVSGKVLTWNESTGRLKLLYTPETMGDFEGDAANPEELRVHPAAFAGDYTVTWRGDQADDQHLAVLFELGSPDEFLMDFGGSAGSRFYPGRLVQYRDGEVVKQYDGIRDRLGTGPYAVTLRVTRRSIEGFLAEKRQTMVKVDRPNQPFGQFGFWPTSFTELVIDGKVEPSWMQGLVDAQLAQQLAAFEQTWKPQTALPKWLFAKPKGKRTKAKWNDSLPMLDELQDGAALERVSQAMAEQKWLDAGNELERMAADAMPTVMADFLRAVVWMRLGRSEQALAACDRTLAGLPGYTSAMLIKANVLEDMRRGPEALVQIEQALANDPGEKSVYERYVVALLQRNRVQDAEAVVRRAKVEHGLWDDLQQVDQMLVMRHRGPTWPRRHVFQSANYEVASDIDLRTCQVAARILESALVNLKVQLAWTANTKKSDRFRVFLFAGEAGYKDYCSKILGSTPSHTAGLYSPVLKQLLIWNVPKREDMERTVRHEGFHQFLDRVVDGPPTWFNEGMAEYWETAQREKGQLRGGQMRRDHYASLLRAKNSLPKLEQLLAGSHNDFYANAHLRYPQAWAFVHFLREGPRDYQQRFVVLWKELRGTGSTDKAIDTAFAGVDWAQVDRDFWAHLASLR